MTRINGELEMAWKMLPCDCAMWCCKTWTFHSTSRVCCAQGSAACGLPVSQLKSLGTSPAWELHQCIRHQPQRIQRGLGDELGYTKWLWCQNMHLQDKSPQPKPNSPQQCQCQAHNGGHIFLTWRKRMNCLSRQDLAGGFWCLYHQCWWGNHWYCHSSSCSQKQSKTNNGGWVCIWGVL